MSASFLLSSFVGLNLTFAEDTKPSVEHVKQNIDITAHIKAGLQDRNRVNNVIKINTPVVEEKLFSRYRNVDVLASVLNRSVDEKNLLGKWAFDPQKNSVLQQKITKSFLTSRGIQEIISIGVSDFNGSTPNRIQNIKASLEKFDGQIVEKGAIFSFNKILKSVEKKDGFVWAKIIVEGKDKWGMGGGVCQVSTNVFRAAFNAGLPIIKRRNHSYAISKYKPHGLDATIYLGQQDLQFQNNTQGDILMKFVMRDKKLFTVFYGTKDTRKVKVLRTKKWAGYDGRVTTHWKRTIVKGSAFQEEVLISNYGPDPYILAAIEKRKAEEAAKLEVVVALEE